MGEVLAIKEKMMDIKNINIYAQKHNKVYLINTKMYKNKNNFSNKIIILILLISQQIQMSIKISNYHSNPFNNNNPIPYQKIMKEHVA